MYENTPTAYLAREAAAESLRREAAAIPGDSHKAARFALVWQNRDARHYGPRYPMGLRFPG